MEHEDKEITFGTIEEYEAYVQDNLHEGYEIADLKKDDEDALWGAGFMACEVENAFDNYIADTDDTVIGKLKREIAQDIWDYIMPRMISAGCDMVYSVMDDYTKYGE